MKRAFIRLTIIILPVLLSVNLFSQVTFEKGYFIDNNKRKTDCLIKNYEWKNSPNQIEYKIAETSESITAKIDSIDEFGVSNYKYRRFTVDIDQSGEIMSNLSETKDPIFKKETLFLRTIVEGEATLYFAGKYKLYFFSVNNSEVVQLIHKEYIAGNRVMANNSYKSQLWEGLKCDCILVQDVEKIAYTRDNLIKIFKEYNNCVGVDFVDFYSKNKKVGFNLNIRPGLKISSLSTEDYYNNSEHIDFGNDITFSFGLEAQLILPFNKNKWAVIFEPTFQYYKKEATVSEVNTSVDTINIDYKSIELPLGIRYSIFFSQKSKMYFSAAVVIMDIPFSSTVGPYNVNTSYSYNLGLGYSFKSKYSVELRYGTPRNILSGYENAIGMYQSFSFILGYNIF